MRFELNGMLLAVAAMLAWFVHPAWLLLIPVVGFISPWKLVWRRETGWLIQPARNDG